MSTNPWSDCVVNGPYESSSGRRVVQIYRRGALILQTTFARYLMEYHLGRLLTSEEQVHHTDGQLDNDVISNLELVDARQHLVDHATRLIPMSFNCPICGVKFSKVGRKLTDLLKRRRVTPNAPGPFCTKSCSISARHRKVTTQLPLEIRSYTKNMLCQ